MGLFVRNSWTCNTKWLTWNRMCFEMRQNVFCDVNEQTWKCTKNDKTCPRVSGKINTGRGFTALSTEILTFSEESESGRCLLASGFFFFQILSNLFINAEPWVQANSRNIVHHVDCYVQNTNKKLARKSVLRTKYFVSHFSDASVVNHQKKAM